MKRQFCHAKFQKSNQKPIFISQNSIIMETDKCLFALIYIFQKLSGLIYLRNSFRFCAGNEELRGQGGKERNAPPCPAVSG